MIISKTNPLDLNGDVGHRIVNRITENIALNENFRLKPAGNRLHYDRVTNTTIKIWVDGRPWGFDIETADYSKLISYFTDPRVKKRNETTKAHVLRYMMVRFPNETARDKQKLIRAIKTISLTDFEMMEADARNDSTFFSDSGFQDRVWLDPKNPTNKGNTKFVKLKHDKFEIKRK